MMAAAKLEIGQFVEFVPKAALAPKPEPQCHYMLRLRTNWELRAERQLHERDIDAYVPKETGSVRGAWLQRSLRNLPIFSGIMFVPDYQADLPRLKSIADGIGGFVKRNGEALRVSPQWMERIRRFELKLDEPPRIRRRYKVGQTVRIVAGGRFELWEARVVRLDSHHRLVALLQVLERDVLEVFDEDEVEAVAPGEAGENVEAGG